MTTSLLQPQTLPPANDGHVRDNLTADERLLKQAVARCLKAQVAEVHGKVEGGAKTNAVPEKTTKWDQEVMREVRPIWFGLFKKGGDRALMNIRRFPKHARKMAVLSWAEMEVSERVEVVQKGGPGSGNFGHEGRPGEVGGSGEGGEGASTVDRIYNEELYFHKVVEDIRANIPSKEVRITDHSIGVLRGNIRGNWMDNDDVWTFYPTRSIPEEFRQELAKRLPDGVRVMNGGVDFPKDKFPTSAKLESSKSLKATPSIVIPEWIEDPDVLTALENEMFKFAHGINQTTADELREELIAGMENGETIDQLAGRISGLSDEWVEGWRSEMIARTETARAFSTGHIEAWRSTGVVSRKIWVSSQDACPFCLEMDGTVIDLDENFFEQGDDPQKVEWRGHTIEMGHDYSDVNGPPLHPNCRCVLVAELDEEKMVSVKGGPGSGNFGHEGRPGEVGGSGPGFAGIHGTSTEFVGSILKEGLSLNRASVNTPWEGITKEGYSFLADKPAMALSYAKYTAFKGNKLPVLVAVTIPKENAHLVERDPTTRSAFQYKGDIKPEWITDVWVAKVFGDDPFHPGWMAVGEPKTHPQNWSKVKSFDMKDDSVSFYIVLLKSITETKSLNLKGGLGSGNFGHEGRPGEVGGSGPGGGSGKQAYKVDITSHEFVKWFGDSRIVNPDGTPLVVYKGFKNIKPIDPETDIVAGEVAFFPDDELRGGRIEPGIYFTPDITVAQHYGTPIPYYLRASNPIQHEDPLEDKPEKSDAIYRMRGTKQGIHNAWEIAIFDPNDAMPVFRKGARKSLKSTPSIVIPEFERVNIRGDQ